MLPKRIAKVADAGFGQGGCQLFLAVNVENAVHSLHVEQDTVGFDDGGKGVAGAVGTHAVTGGSGGGNVLLDFGFGAYGDDGAG